MFTLFTVSINDALKAFKFIDRKWAKKKKNQHFTFVVLYLRALV